MEAGQTEVVVSQSEHIGLPNWSSVNILVSAKATCASGSHDAVDDYLSGIVKAVVDNRTLKIFKSLHAWATNVAMEVPEFQTTQFDVSGLDMSGYVELTFGMTERIGLPNKSHISILDSRKTLSTPGEELFGFQYLFDSVEKKMAQRRGIVKENARPWIEAS